jgi:hypothetical protein
VVASLLGAAVRAELKGALAEQFQVALDSRVLIERAKGRVASQVRWKSETGVGSQQS